MQNDSWICSVFSRCNKDTVICRTDICPGIHFTLKVIPFWMEKRSFLCKFYNRISIKTGLCRLNLVLGIQYHQQTRNEAQLWAIEVFESSYLSINIICNKTGGLAINRYRKLTTFAKDESKTGTTLQTSATNDVHCFSVSFFTCFVHGR